VYRDSSGQPAAFVATLAVDEVPAVERSADPAIRSATRYLEQRAPLRSGEKALYFRFWMARDTYQGVSGLQSLIFGRAAQLYLTTPGLAFSFFSAALPKFWAPMFAHVDLPLIAEAGYTIDGRRFGVFGHDWRATPPFAWLELLGEREIVSDAQTLAPDDAGMAIVLSEPDFADAVRDAIRDLYRPVALRQNPLLRSRLVIERSGAATKPADRVDALTAVVREAIDILARSPRDAKLYRALNQTYLEPAPTQERAAEILDLPFSTYRRHLASALARVVDVLWKREIGEPSG
jgi:hypothetical protein